MLSVSVSVFSVLLKFLTKLQHSENTISLCRLFEKHIIDESDIVREHLFSYR